MSVAKYAFVEFRFSRKNVYGVYETLHARYVFPPVANEATDTHAVT